MNKELLDIPAKERTMLKICRWASVCVYICVCFSLCLCYFFCVAGYSKGRHRRGRHFFIQLSTLAHQSLISNRLLQVVLSWCLWFSFDFVIHSKIKSFTVETWSKNHYNAMESRIFLAENLQVKSLYSRKLSWLTKLPSTVSTFFLLKFLIATNSTCIYSVAQR